MTHERQKFEIAEVEQVALDAKEDHVDRKGREVGQVILSSDNVHSMVEECQMVFWMRSVDVRWNRRQIGDRYEQHHEQQSCTVDVVGSIVLGLELS